VPSSSETVALLLLQASHMAHCQPHGIHQEKVCAWQPMGGGFTRGEGTQL
jgi:hypothetical protein